MREAGGAEAGEGICHIRGGVGGLRDLLGGGFLFWKKGKYLDARYDAHFGDSELVVGVLNKVSIRAQREPRPGRG